MSFLSQPKTFKLRNTYVNGFLDCSGDIILRSGNVIIGNISQPGYNANQLSVLIHGRTEMNGNVIVNGNLLVSSNNIALGLRAGNIVNGIQDGVPNGLNTTAVGSFSGMNHTGQNNTFVGSVAGQTSSTTYASRTGNNNTYLGHRTSANNSAWGNSTAVGTGAVITASNQIVLGTAGESVTTAGNVRITNQTNSLNTTSGALQVSGGVGVGGAIIAGGSIYAGYGNSRSVELGADATNTAYIDFHSLDGVSNDYDSRIISIGGTSGTSARGALTLQAETVSISGNLNLGGLTAFNGGSKSQRIDITAGSSAVTPTNAWYGSHITIFGSTDKNQTIPTGVGVTSKIELLCEATATQTITSSGSNFYGAGYNANGSLKLRPGDLVTLVSNNYSWLIMSHTNLNAGGRTLITRDADGTQTLASGAAPTVLFPTDIDSGSSTGLTYSNGVFTNNRGCPIVCNISGCVAFSGNATGVRVAWIEHSATGKQRLSTIDLTNNGATEDCNIPFCINTKLANGENFTIKAYQNSGATLTLRSTTISQTTCTIIINDSC